MPKTPPTRQPESAPLPLTPWQRQCYPLLGTGLKWLPRILALALVLMMIWTALPRGNGSTVKVDPNNIFVSDNAHLLSAETKATIHQQNARYKTLPKRPQLMVITVDRLPANTSIEAFTLQQATRLGVGAAGEDSGIVYLIAKAERQARLEVGYGMESQVPDAMTDVITDERVTSAYRRGDYDAGVQLVTQRLDQLIRTGEIQASRIQAARPVSGSHPLAAVWTWLNTPRPAFTVLLAAIAVALGLFGLRRWGLHLQARVWLDDLVQGYLAAMRGIAPALSPTELLTVPPADATRPARATLLAQLRPAGAKVRQPDYFSMPFAVGHTTQRQFYANAHHPGTEFQRTSMYHQHRQDWYKAKPHQKRRMRLRPKHTRTVPANEVRPYLLSPLAQAWWWLVRGLTNGLTLVLLVLGLYWVTGNAHTEWALRLHARMQDLGQAGWAFLDRLLAAGQTPLQQMNALVLGGLVGGLLLVGYLLLDACHTRAMRHLALNRMIRDFLSDLRARLSQPVSDQALAAILAADDATIARAKTTLKTTLGGKARGKQTKGSLPDYYDMAFAFGHVSAADFFTADETTKAYKTSSMYVNHAADWYGSGSNDGGGSGGGGSDSFGGGGFGGGGGTSSW